MARFGGRLTVPLLIVTTLLAALAASAQPPKGAPKGTICLTPSGWCKAVKPGPSGAPCACPRPNGWIQGKLN